MSHSTRAAVAAAGLRSPRGGQPVRSLRIEICRDVVGGADTAARARLRGLADRATAAGCLLTLDSAPSAKAMLATEIPCVFVIGEDQLLFREGLVSLLREAGFEVVAQAGDGPDLVRKALAHQPDIVIADVRMPPGHDDDGLRAALDIRRRRPGTAILVLSAYVVATTAAELMAEGAEGIGYLIKDRVMDLDRFADTIRHVASGGSALDPKVVAACSQSAAPGRSTSSRPASLRSSP